jgi:hypothetical protein
MHMTLLTCHAVNRVKVLLCCQQHAPAQHVTGECNYFVPVPVQRQLREEVGAPCKAAATEKGSRRCQQPIK